MNSNELREYVKKLNEQEAYQTELRRQKALKRIRELRTQKDQQQKEAVNDHSI